MAASSNTRPETATPAPEERDRDRFRQARRALLGLGAFSALTSRDAEAQVRTPRSSRPISVTPGELRLLDRTTNGATAQDVAYIYSIGYHQYLDWQLGAEAIADPDCDARVSAYSTVSLPPVSLYTLDAAMVTRQLAEATVTRAVYSNRQLFERMVEFWGDHFHTNVNTVGIHKVFEDREVFRKLALTNFFELLVGSAASPAMLTYLNNTDSTRSAPNQNYARELMELHTLGVDGGYTQQDVIEVARAFTGWRRYGSTGDGRAGSFYYDAGRHDNNAKLVLGVPIAAGGGINDGFNVLRILADQPSTARFVSRKMLRWLLDYNPSTTLVNDVAGEFARTRGDVKAVIRRILAYENVLWAPPLLKRPFHYIVSALRVLNANVTNLDTVRNTYLSGSGHAPFAWGPPNGYPQSFDYWGGLPLPRWNYAFNLANNGVSGATFDLPALLAGATTAVQVADRIETRLFTGDMPEADKAALIAYLRPDPPSTSRIRDAIGLALASPAFQWH